ncbi:hypothetical protein SteCoe_8248 [Stentor coeruleus]|uniref:Tubulin--tyrosine ligase-like protein 9 n=1 Tax=Stentor coeruleus TaxID=5963 RepID=A0A1R2CKK0_9CILI|nr:hypothetical protein SteCoe_8248 [Stentor coeruleus]
MQELISLNSLKKSKHTKSEKSANEVNKIRKCLHIQKDLIKGILNFYTKSDNKLLKYYEPKKLSSELSIKHVPNPFIQVSTSPYLSSKLTISSKIGGLEKTQEVKKSQKPVKNIKKNSASIFKNRTRLSSSHLELKIIRLQKPFDMWKYNNKINLDSKIFVIKGKYPDLRAALIKRGWIENTNHESIFYDLKWSRSARVPGNINDWQVFNHFPRNLQLTAKWNLCKNLNKQILKPGGKSSLYFFPRCFKLNDRGFQRFNEYFKINYATSMIKEAVNDIGKYHYEKVAASIQISKKWIEKLKFGIDEEEYDIILNNDWRILSTMDFRTIGSYYAKCYKDENLQEAIIETNMDLRVYDPQYYINGSKNIWIIKPGRKSRGRDISIHTCIRDIYNYTNSSDLCVVQKYIENPLLINSKKFDIRQWVLVSNSDPLTIWIFKECYLRFTINDYTLSELSNIFAHLTNNTISKKSKEFHNSEIQGCMWNLRTFKEYLICEFEYDVWNSRIFPDIKHIVKRSLISVGNLGRKNSFELFGYDLMVDNNLNTWLIEINSSPAMDYSTSITENLVKIVMEDIVKVIVDYGIDSNADTGNFELIYTGKVRKKCSD